VALLLATAAALLFPSLGAGPFERAEIYFMDGARSMLERADALVPYYQGEPFFDKPALAYWLMAGSFRLFGVTPAAGRAPAALAALGSIAATVWLGSLLFGRRAALAGAIALATTLAFVSFGRIAMSDMLLTLWSTLAVALATAAFRENAPRGLVPGLGAVLGLGFLTKGPVALLMPGIPLLLMLRPPAERPRLRRGSIALAAVLFAIVGLGWFAAVYARLGAEPLAHFFLRENVERFAGETYDVGVPFWYYPPAYLATGLPWSLLVPVALWRVGREPGAARARLLAWWVALALVPLSLSRGKLDYYLLPLYPALSLLVGRWLVAVAWTRGDRGWARATMLVAAGGFVALAFLPTRIEPLWLPAPPVCQAFQTLAAFAAVASLIVAVRPSPRRVFATLAGSSATLGLLLVVAFLPAFRTAQPNRDLVADVARELEYAPAARVVACSDPARVQRDILFFARARVTERCDLWSLAPTYQRFLFLLRPEEFRSLETIPGFREVSRYRYLPATMLTLEGLLAPPPPGLVILAANYATLDPTAEMKRKRDRKRELRSRDE
jgi:4-amino-4-deoxy-L-arabinose transferase-like glycosyltransferase